MIFSMTAFSRTQLDEVWGSLVWEIRSVNHRYLEASVRLPEPLRGLESAIRESLRGKLNRGKVECQLRFQASPQQQAALLLNRATVEQLLVAAGKIRELSGELAPMSVTDVLRWPGVLEEKDSRMEIVEAAALALFSAALDEMLNVRAREGEELGRLIETRLVTVREIVKEVRALLPDILARQRKNLTERLSEIRQELDPARLEQELVLLAQKSDVDEELDRLDSHVAEVQRVLQTPGQIGRRLDFLMQELNREANTLSSKSVVAETTRSAVELKVLIEQMREQIQNIE
ncbi:MAG: YicC/YloC family endoribonuclease [Pseudohongiellaceae bacterium]